MIMLDGDNGEGVTSFTRYATIEELNAFKHDVRAALYGAEGTNGMVKDIHELKMWIKFLGIIGVFLSPVITALILKYMFGV